MMKISLAESKSQDYKYVTLLDAQDHQSKTFRDGFRISISKKAMRRESLESHPGNPSIETLIFCKKRKSEKGVEGA